MLRPITLTLLSVLWLAATLRAQTSATSQACIPCYLQKVIFNPVDAEQRAVLTVNDLAVYRDQGDGDLGTQKPLLTSSELVDDVAYAPNGDLYGVYGEPGIADAPPGFFRLYLRGLTGSDTAETELVESARNQLLNARLAFSADGSKLYVVVYDLPYATDDANPGELVIYTYDMAARALDDGRTFTYNRPFGYASSESITFGVFGDKAVLMSTGGYTLIDLLTGEVESASYIEGVSTQTVTGEAFYAFGVTAPAFPGYTVTRDTGTATYRMPTNLLSAGGAPQVAADGTIVVTGGTYGEEGDPDSLFVFSEGDTLAEAYPWYQGATNRITSLQILPDGRYAATALFSPDDFYETNVPYPPIYSLEAPRYANAASFVITAATPAEFYQPRPFTPGATGLTEYSLTPDPPSGLGRFAHRLRFDYDGALVDDSVGLTFGFVEEEELRASQRPQLFYTTTTLPVGDTVELFTEDRELETFTSILHVGFWPTSDYTLGTDRVSSISDPTPRKRSLAQLSLSPNPVGDEVTVSLAGGGFAARSWSVTDVSGRRTPVEASGNSGERLVFTVSHFPAGSYVLEGRGPVDTVVGRFLRQ